MQFIVALLKKLPWDMVGAVVVAFVLGLVIGWRTVKFKDADPTYLRRDLQIDYLRMAIDSFRVNQNANLAVQRWKNLGPVANDVYQAIQLDPQGMDPNVITVYGQTVQAILLSEGATPEGTETTGGNSFLRMAVTVGGIIAVVVILIAGILFLRTFLGKRGSGEPTPV